ncbi:flavodoxin family protein [Leifsonia sp. McL0607]|uniref:flavodoxin family protein n=1 Tax=Leifsonia sp. McL0607 TaxID=3415672 RepID=UPI003CF4174C
MNETASVARAAIVYESMFGNTRQVAEAIAEGLREAASVTILRVKDAPEAFSDADLLLIGAPTHAHGLSRPSTREEAAKWSDDPARSLALEPDAEGIGVREWLESCGEPPARFAAFDTRADMTELFTGSAASAIDKRLRRLGSRRLVGKHSFLVDKDSVLVAGQLEDARAWGREVAAALRARAAV